jgi:hypothetical protein
MPLNMTIPLVASPRTGQLEFKYSLRQKMLYSNTNYREGRFLPKRTNCVWRCGIFLPERGKYLMRPVPRPIAVSRNNFGRGHRPTKKQSPWPLPISPITSSGKTSPRSTAARPASTRMPRSKRLPPSSNHRLPRPTMVGR